MTKNRKLWLDTRGQPVITTTANGERNALRWGWTPAVAVAKGSLDASDIVAADEGAAALQELCDLARRGRDDFLYQAEHGDYSPEDQEAAALRWEAVSELIDTIEYSIDPTREEDPS